MSETECEPTPVEELLVRAKGGEQGALNELLQRFRPFMERIAAGAPEFGSYGHSDLVQDAQLLVFSKFGQFQGSTTGEFCNWLRRIVVNKGVDHVRRRHDVGPFPQNSSGQIQIPEKTSSTGVSSEEIDRLRQAVAKLPKRYQEVVHLRDFEEGMTDSVIASILGTSEQNVRQLHSRAVKKLGELLGGSSQ